MSKSSKSSSSSSSSSKSSAKKEPSGHRPIIHKEDHKLRYPNNNDVEPYDFTKSHGCTCCCCVGFVWQRIMTVTAGSFLFGMNMSLMNTSVNAISVDYWWCHKADIGCSSHTIFVSFIQVGVFIGAAIGSMTGGRFLAIGRRMMLLMSTAVFTVGIVSSCVSNSFSALVWARLVVGYGVGLVSVVCPTYLSEISPKHKRGTYGVMHQLMITVGIFVAVLLGLAFSSIPYGSYDPALGETPPPQPMFDKVWWRVMLGLGMIPTIIIGYLFAFTYTHETPHYYAEKKQYDDCTNILRLIYNKDDVAEEMKDIMDGIAEAEKAAREGLGCCKAMGSSTYAYVIAVGCLLSAFQQLTGINVFMAQSNKLFADAGFEGAAVTGFSVAITGVNMLMTFPSLWLIEKLGRKTLMLIGVCGQLCGVLPAMICYWIDEKAVYTQWVSIAGSLIFIIFFAVAYGPVLWVYLFEIYPAEIRGSAAGAATAMNWIAGIVMVFVSTYVNNQVNFTIFAVTTIIAIVIVAVMMKETKGRSIDDSPYMKNHNKA